MRREILKLARYLNRSIADIEAMPFSEFKEWMDFMSEYPPENEVMDIHLSNLIAITINQGLKKGAKRVDPTELRLTLSKEEKEAYKEHRLIQRLKEL